MRFVKYIPILLAIFIILLIAGFVFLNADNNKPIPTPSPTSYYIPTPTPETNKFSLENAPTESLKGQITKMTGNVMWQGRIATGAAQIFSPISIQQGENLSTGKKSSLSLVFTNAATVNFSENTAVGVIQTLPADMVFSQTTGTVEYIKTGNFPVTVRANYLLVNIDGDILISFNTKGPIVTLSVKSGTALAAFNDLKYISHEVTISKGRTFTFNYGTRRGALK